MNDQVKPRDIAFISSFPPRRCGLATFTGDLIANLEPMFEPGTQPFVIAMESQDGHRYQPPVECAIRRDLIRDYIEAADYINFRTPQVVSLQHEFGLFGGEAGSYIRLLTDRLEVPLVTTFHTVLERPSGPQRQVVQDISANSEAVVVMNARGIDMLTHIYHVPAEKIRLIPHGIPDLPHDEDDVARQQLGLAQRKVILTFGLLSQNKGIEVMLRAMETVAKAHPEVLYIVLGITHPEVVRHEGYRYVNHLYQLVSQLNLGDHVVLNHSYASDETLHLFLRSAHIYVTPYLQKEQLTSGTLAFAVGAGKAVISTPYWAAEELLADDRGILVPFGDSNQMALEILNLLDNDERFKTLKDRAYEYGRSITWPETALMYRRLFLEPAQKPKSHISPFPSNGSTADVADFKPGTIPIATAVLQGLGH